MRRERQIYWLRLRDHAVGYAVKGDRFENNEDKSDDRYVVERQLRLLAVVEKALLVETEHQTDEDSSIALRCGRVFAISDRGAQRSHRIQAVQIRPFIITNEMYCDCERRCQRY